MDETMNNKSLKFVIAGSAFLAILVLAGIFFFYPQAEKAKEVVPLKDWSAPVSSENWGDLSTDTPLESDTQTPETDSPFVVVGEDDQTTIVTQTETAPPSTPIPTEKVQPAPVTVKPAPVSPPVVAKPVPKVKVTEFWIQVAAYADRYAAERSSQTLSAQNMAAVLFTAQNDKGTVFRVRIGPYQNKQEAEKYLEWVKAIKDFSGAYITQSSALRELR